MMSNVLAQAKLEQCMILIGEMTYDPQNRQFSKDGQAIELEPRTLELLEVVLQQVGTPIA
ncbi:hypothetical protein [Shewanella sp. NIFS-20-20]|uniref:hypothetical protein n=1 Tax=Shewanella sp. NIFS-20-20 TaxID=2853806 RepID=UPI001C46EC94|nr:hypothetical protein [Shewanella sp. NIFS-20-20]MBV7314460.1 hypothetical protein [Shewanella sp. NIFS-20-20]